MVKVQRVGRINLTKIGRLFNAYVNLLFLRHISVKVVTTSLQLEES